MGFICAVIVLSVPVTVVAWIAAAAYDASVMGKFE